MKRQLFALIVSAPDDVSLSALGRAIAYAPRCDAIRVRRTFVSSGNTDSIGTQQTQQIRIPIDVEAD